MALSWIWQLTKWPAPQLSAFIKLPDFLEKSQKDM